MSNVRKFRREMKRQAGKAHSRQAALPARRLDDFSDVSTDELLVSFLRVGDILMHRGVDVVDEQTKHAIDARWELVHYLEDVPSQIAKLVAFINGAALTGTGSNLRTVLFTPNMIEGQALDCQGLLGGLYTEALSNCQMYAPEIAAEFRTLMEPIITGYLDAMQRLKDGSDNGEALRALSRDQGTLTSLDALSRLTRPGRKAGATPVNQYILDQLVRLKKLHQLRTRGEVYEKLMEVLGSRQDVQNWIEVKPTLGKRLVDELVKRPVPVQAYESIQGLSREDGAERLRRIERDENSRNRR